MIRVWTLALVAIFGVGRTAAAEPITWIFTGPVEFTYGQWVDILPLGTPAQLTVTWESSTPSVPGCPPGSGLYPAITGATLSVLNYSVSYGGAIEVAAPGGNCGFSNLFDGVEFHMFGQSQTGQPFTGAFDELFLVVDLADRFGADLSAILAPVEFGTVIVQTLFGPSAGFDFSGPLQEVTPVPEPATILLFGSGLAIAVRSARRNRVWK